MNLCFMNGILEFARIPIVAVCLKKPFFGHLANIFGTLDGFFMCHRCLNHNSLLGVGNKESKKILVLHSLPTPSMPLVDLYQHNKQF
nr:H52 [uncultured bacterium]